MESKIIKIVASLGVPGLALGVFYMIIKNLELSSAPPDWVGPLMLVTLLFSALITFYALGFEGTSNILTRFSEDIPKERQDALSKKWIGTLKQESREDADVTIKLKVKGKEVKGEMECYYADIGSQKFDVSGSFHSGNFLRLDYANKDRATVHFGTCYFELSADGKRLKGSCVGFGIKAEKIVTASIMLKRS